MVKISKYTLLALAGTVLLSSGFSKPSEAAGGLASVGASLSSAASSVASFADNALGQIQDYTCRASGASPLLTGYENSKIKIKQFLLQDVALMLNMIISNPLYRAQYSYLHTTQEIYSRH